MEMLEPGGQFDFMSKRRYFIGASVLLVLLSILACFRPGLRLGTDFRGGTEIEVEFTAPVTAGEVRHAVEKAGFDAPDLVAIGDGETNRYIIRVQEVSALSESQKVSARERLCLVAEGESAPEARCPPAIRATEVKFSQGGDKISARYETAPDLAGIARQLEGAEGIELRPGGTNPVLVSPRDHKVDIHLKSKGDQLLDGLRAQLGSEKVPDRAMRVEWIGPKAGAQLRDTAIKSVGIALVFIVAYVAIRFDLRFAPGGILSLAHDVIIAMGAMAITQREITLSTVAAMLTIVGYSINDTVIVYDRIRENLPKNPGVPFATVINLSVSEMLGRTIITSGVTALSLIAFLWWGTGALRDFSFALLIGMAAGTYSSIYVAAPLTHWVDATFFKGSMVGKKASRQRRGKRADSVV